MVKGTMMVKGPTEVKRPTEVTFELHGRGQQLSPALPLS